MPIYTPTTSGGGAGGNTITTGVGTLTLNDHTVTAAGDATISGTNTGDQSLSGYLATSTIGVSVQGYSASTTVLGNTTTGSGSIVLNTSPTFVTPSLGVATATSINGVTFGTGSGSLSIADGKTLTASNTLTFTGTDSSSVAFGAGGTVSYTSAANPTGSLGLTAVNGSASTFMRSDGAPALNVAIAPTWTGAHIFSAKPLTLSGNQSVAAWTTTGTGLIQAATSYTDTSSSGTVTAATINSLGVPTVLASSSTTYTDFSTTRLVGPPVASTNVTMTRKKTLTVVDSTSAASAITGGVVVCATEGTTATSVGIGGGNVNAGGSVTAATVFANPNNSAVLVQVGYSNTGLGNAANNYLSLYANGTENMRMQSSINIYRATDFSTTVTMQGSLGVTGATTATGGLIIGASGTSISGSKTFTSTMSQSISTLTSYEHSITATGVVAGDVAALDIPAQPDGIVLCGWRTTTDAILVKFYNTTVGSLSLTGTIKARSFKA